VTVTFAALPSLPRSFLTTIFQGAGDKSLLQTPDATSFNPERFLDEHGKLIPGPVETRDDGHSAYGFGRRACVGKHAANDSLFIDMATVLWAAQLEHARDENGKEIPLDSETPVDSGMVL
jgi:cytochrome P450